MSGTLVILSGPSGVGKDTVIDAWKLADPRVERVVAYTTRAPRPGEQDGLDYNFRDRETFLTLVGEGAFLEHKLVHDNYYATPLRDLEAMLDRNQVAVLKIDVQGALSVMDLRPDAVTVFLLPPDMEELESRIKGRGADSPEAIEKRLRNAREEIAQADRYGHRLVNRQVGEVVTRLREIIP